MAPNGYSYVHGNPVNWTDPSGEFLPLPAAIGLGFGLGGLIAGGIELGGQVHHNMAQCGMDFWNAIHYKNLDRKRLGTSMLEGAILGGIGAGFGYGIAAAGFEGGTAWLLGGIYDVGTGVLWDVAFHGDTPSDALLSNLISFGVGEAIGYGIGCSLDFVNVYRFQRKTETDIITGGAFRRRREDYGWDLVKANKERKRLFRRVFSDDPSVRVNALQAAQGGGNSSLFISTSFSESWAARNRKEIQAKTGLEFELIAIRGLRSGGVDFEAVFKELGGRTKPTRFKDAEMQEFGIMDLFVPPSGTSKSGFFVLWKK